MLTAIRCLNNGWGTVLKASFFYYFILKRVICVYRVIFRIAIVHPTKSSDLWNLYEYQEVVYRVFTSLMRIFEQYITRGAKNFAEIFLHIARDFVLYKKYHLTTFFGIADCISSSPLFATSNWFDFVIITLCVCRGRLTFQICTYCTNC